LIEQKDTGKQQLGRRLLRGKVLEAKPATLQHYRRYGKSKHNVQTYQKAEETSKEDELD